MAEQNSAKMSDEILVLSAQAGDIDAVDFLVGKYTAIASKKAARLYESIQIHDIDDLTQEAMIGFLSAIYSYKSDKGASFTTYANICMNNRLLSVASAMNAKRHVPQNAMISLENTEIALNDIQYDPQELAISRYRSDKLSELINSELSEFERGVIRLFLSGNSYSDIAKKMSADKKAVDNAMQRIRRKLKAKMLQY